jgi:ketosteroid isomerase-like protein
MKYLVDIEAEKKEIRRIFNEHLFAYDKKDLDKTVNMFSEDVIVHRANNPQFQGKKTLTEDYKNSFESLKDSTASTTEEAMYVEVSSSGDMAWSCGNYTTHYERTGDTRIVDGKYIIAWRKIDDKWKVAAFCATSNLPQA